MSAEHDPRCSLVAINCGGEPGITHRLTGTVPLSLEYCFDCDQECVCELIAAIKADHVAELEALRRSVIEECAKAVEGRRHDLSCCTTHACGGKHQDGFCGWECNCDIGRIAAAIRALTATSVGDVAEPDKAQRACEWCGYPIIWVVGGPVGAARPGFWDHEDYPLDWRTTSHEIPNDPVTSVVGVRHIDYTDAYSRAASASTVEGGQRCAICHQPIIRVGNSWGHTTSGQTDHIAAPAPTVEET